MNKIFAALSISLSIVSLASCAKDGFQEISEIPLSRCLQPTNLNAKVSSLTGVTTTFIWDVAKDATQYNLVICTDRDMKNVYLDKKLKPNEVPFVIDLDPDAVFYFKVQASGTGRSDSNWAIYCDDNKNAKAINTFAVKDCLYPKIKATTHSSVTLTWWKEASDYMNLDRIEYYDVDTFQEFSRDLTNDEIVKAEATIDGLNPTKVYVFSLYYASANRGDVIVKTPSNTEGCVNVSNVTELNAKLAEGKDVHLLLSGSPYDLKDLNTDGRLTLKNGARIIGEEGADGSKPVLNGEIHIADGWEAGQNLYFEGIEFNGVDDTYGFPIQKLNGGADSDVTLGSLIFKNCVLKGYSKGLIYEWGKAFKIGELTWDGCDIVNINKEGSGGGDVIDFRGASEIGKLNIINNTIYQGMRTFIRIDAGTWGEINVENNTMMNLCFVDNTNNAGLFGLQIAPASLSFKNNLILNMPEKSVLSSTNAKYKTVDDLPMSAGNNWFYNVNDLFFNDRWPMSKVGGSILTEDPCYNARGGLFYIDPDSPISGKKVGAPKWWINYIEEPEDLTLNVIKNPKVWDFGDARYFVGTITKKMVRDDLFINASEDTPVQVLEGPALGFSTPTICTKKGVPSQGYLAFKVDKPGSVVIKAAELVGSTGHFIVGTSDKDGGNFSIKGGVAAIPSSQKPQKVVINDIAEETLIYVYVSDGATLSNLAWSEDITDINTALASPEPQADPTSFTAGEATEVVVSWSPVPNAASYSVKFSGKTYTVEGESSYTIAGKTTAMLDAGSYTVEVYANPGKDDIYNTMSAAGTTAFAVLPKGGGGDDEFIVSSVEEFMNALSAGKDAITFKFADTPYDLGNVVITSPLHLKGQTSGGKKTALTASFTLSGGIGGSVVFRNLEFVGAASPASLIIEDKTADCAPITDTIAVYDSYIHGIKALFDNSGKAVSDAQYVIFKGNIIEDSSDGADFIDMRTGAHHNFIFVNNTVANSCRTFVRTDAIHEMNYATIRNNTFYKVATNSSSKDNNGIFHIRSTAGAGMLDYKVQNNLFYSILIDTEPGNDNGFPKFVSKTGLVPNTIMNNYYYNCEDREEKAAYSFWAYIPKEQTLTGGGAILPADPCKNAANGDFTLTNGVAMVNNIGDPRWNPMRDSKPTSEITVKDVDELLTAISAGKTTITLASGEYDLTTLSGVEGVENGKITLTSTINLIGQAPAVFKGGFIFKGGIDKFTAKGITFDGAASVDNVFEIAEASVKMSSVIIRGCEISGYKNRLFYMNCEGSLQSLEFQNNIIHGEVGADFTSGDFIDIRKGTAKAIKVQNNTFANCVRTFARIDATTVLESMAVVNNTFYNLCYVDSKDNNGIFHVRATSLDESQFNVHSNIFASMHKASETPAQTNGYPKIVSTNTASKIPTFRHNYFYDLDHTEGYDFWTKDRVTEEAATAGYGVILAADPFKDAARLDFTLLNALAASEKVGDQRWNTARPQRPDGFFEAPTLDELLSAIEAGKQNILLTGTSYDFTADETLAGTLTVGSGLTLKGQLSHGLKPEIKGVFNVTATTGAFELNNVMLNGNSSLSDMIVIAKDADISKLTVVNCDVINYKNRLISGPNEAVCGPVIVKGCQVSGVEGANFTGGDFIDFRKGTVSSIKVMNSTFANAIRTFVRVDADVKCDAVSVENNTFYNVLTALSKDNNGIMHVRSSSATSNPRQITVRKNIFACSHPDEAGLATAADNVKAAGFPKLVSTASEKIAHPTISDNIFFDLKFEGDAYLWWNTMTPESIAAAGQVLTETPFSGDPTTGKFTVKTAYKGYGDVRW